MRLQLVGGAYASRSIIASAMKCINYYPEINPRSSIIPITHYQRGGLTPVFNTGDGGPVRCLYRASNGQVAYMVSNNNVYMINSNLVPQFLGQVTAGLTNPCSIIDNGTTVVIVDNSSTGWQVPLGQVATPTPITDVTQTFVGATKVDFVDGFIVFNIPNTNNWGSTIFNQIDFGSAIGGGYFGTKIAYSDPVVSIYVNRREILVFGQVKTEVWYNVGAYPFPFQELPGTYIEHGLLAPYSVASHDINIMWLAQDLQGGGQVFQFRGYFAQRISNHALEDAIREMMATSTVTDAIGMAYQQDGHWFYMLTFPSGDQTWVYDSSITDPSAAWHQETWTNPTDNSQHRHRAMSVMNFQNAIYMGDNNNGVVYSNSLDTYVDIVSPSQNAPYATCPITCTRTFPHIGSARAMGTMQEMINDGRRLIFSGFRADIESGMGPTDVNGNPAQVTLRWSDDRGRTFGTDVLQTNGMPGEYLTQPQWLGLGIARDRIFEISHQIAGPAALNGAWIDCEVAGS